MDSRARRRRLSTRRAASSTTWRTTRLTRGDPSEAVTPAEERAAGAGAGRSAASQDSKAHRPDLERLVPPTAATGTASSAAAAAAPPAAATATATTPGAGGLLPKGCSTSITGNGRLRTPGRLPAPAGRRRGGAPPHHRPRPLASGRADRRAGGAAQRPPATRPRTETVEGLPPAEAARRTAFQGTLTTVINPNDAHIPHAESERQGAAHT